MYCIKELLVDLQFLYRTRNVFEWSNNAAIAQTGYATTINGATVYGCQKKDRIGYFHREVKVRKERVAVED